MNIKSLFGDKKFYRTIFSIAVPIMIQNGITNFVALLDNIMIGQVGTEQMSGTAIVNQLLFVFNLCIFGILAGPGIFGAQYAGRRDREGFRSIFRMKLLLAAFTSLAALGIFLFAGEPLLSLYLSEGDTPAARLATLGAAKRYLAWILPGIPVFALTQSYTSSLREWGETMLPMRAGITAVLVNLCFNWLLIFGHLGFPEMGVAGAALATTISRFVELGIVAVYAHRSVERFPFLVDLYKSFRIPGKLLGDVARKGSPLLANEFLWSMGKSSIVQAYSYRGLTVIAAMNICSTVANLFNIFYMSVGTAVAILLGQVLGTGDMEKAKDTCRKLMALSTLVGVVVGIGVSVIAPMIANMYNTEQAVKSLATDFLRITALAMPLFAFGNASYFTLRSGGKTGITFLFDCGYTVAIELPVAMLLCRFTGLDTWLCYLLVQQSNWIKVLLGGWLVGKGVWLKKIV
jgi:putative MATE family efflux protein